MRDCTPSTARDFDLLSQSWITERHIQGAKWYVCGVYLCRIDSGLIAESLNSSTEVAKPTAYATSTPHSPTKEEGVIT